MAHDRDRLRSSSTRWHAVFALVTGCSVAVAREATVRVVGKPTARTVAPPRLLTATAARRVHAQTGDDLNPASWGSDHVGKPRPDYTTGDECLFCHRMGVGSGWLTNRHFRTIRELEADSDAGIALRADPVTSSIAKEVRLLLGERRQVRFLKPGRAFGSFEVLSIAWVPPNGVTPGRLNDAATPKWEADRFTRSCVGCHTTWVDPATKAFSSPTLDCVVCHGVVPDAHTKQGSLALLSRKASAEPRVVASICAQCHVRTGRSRSTGAPYPNQFVPGDNVFRDLAVNLGDSALAEINSADRHVLRNLRDVAVRGGAVTCVRCHDLHDQSTRRHRTLADSPICYDCHVADAPKAVRRTYEVHSATCEY